MLQAGGAHASARVGEMLGLMARCSANPLDPAWLLDMLGLSSSVRTPIRRLSGGQVQRLSLAMALVGRPEMLFLDEPTAGMDPQARHLVWDLLRAARADGVSILLTTHLLDEAELLADRIVIIDNGRSVADATPDELTGGGSSQLRFTASPGLDLDSPPGVAARLPGRGDGSRAVPAGGRHHPGHHGDRDVVLCQGRRDADEPAGRRAKSGRGLSGTDRQGATRMTDPVRASADGRYAANGATTPFPAGAFTPDPRRASSWQMVRAASGLELRMLVRNGEQLLLALIIPLAVLIGLTTTSIVDLATPRIDTVTPGVLALAIMSTAFTSQAITTAFDRRYGVLKRLAAAGMGRGLLVAANAGVPWWSSSASG